jgi:hypothetical protein
MLPSPAAERRKSANLAPGPSANELRSPARSGNRARVNLQPAQSPAHRQRGPPNQHFETPQGFRPRCRRAGTAASIAERADCRSCRRAAFSCRRATTTSARRRSSACGRQYFLRAAGVGTHQGCLSLPTSVGRSNQAIRPPALIRGCPCGARVRAPNLRYERQEVSALAPVRPAHREHQRAQVGEYCDRAASCRATPLKRYRFRQPPAIAREVRQARVG